VIFSMIVTIALGVFPAPLLNFISNLATFIR
jgi:NADH-quinone oxidoreductase subunit N